MFYSPSLNSVVSPLVVFLWPVAGVVLQTTVGSGSLSYTVTVYLVLTPLINLTAAASNQMAIKKDRPSSHKIS